MINLKLVFRFLKGRCHGNQFLLILSAELIFFTLLAGGAVGRANLRLCCASSFFIYISANMGPKIGETRRLITDHVSVPGNAINSECMSEIQCNLIFTVRFFNVRNLAFTHGEILRPQQRTLKIEF